MNIGIDIRVLAKGTRTGIEEYVLNLLPRLLALDLKIKYKLFYNAFKKIKLDYPWLKLPNVELKESRIPNRILDSSVQILKWPKIDKFLGNIDIFFSPHFLPVALSKKCKRVVTFHDLSFEHHPEFFSSSRKLWHWLTFPKSQAEKADKIITDSQSTKEDLVKIYKIDPKKIEVVYPAQSVNLGFRSGNESKSENKKKANIFREGMCGVYLGVSKNFRPLKKPRPAQRTILYFGTIEPRKNLILIIKAFEALKKGEGMADLRLIIAGAKGWLYKDILEQAERSRFKKDIIFIGVVDDKDKPRLYNSADVFVYPSFFEGFGFPPLEAMACGMPTIVSNTSSLPEVVGRGAIMIDPYNVDELALAIREVLEDKDLRENLIKKGLKQTKKFDWDKTAKQVLNIFKNL